MVGKRTIIAVVAALAAAPGLLPCSAHAQEVEVQAAPETMAKAKELFEAGGRAYEVADHIDHQAAPVLVTHDLDGRRIDRARLSPAHLDLLKDLARINRPPYEGGSWHHHFALGHLLADPGLYCSLIVTNQTAYAIYKYAPEHRRWLVPLLSGEA